MSHSKPFGKHVKSLRRARGVTQEVLAERCGLSPDTIRRLERGSFSPSLETLRKLCEGMNMRLSSLFEFFELEKRYDRRELEGLLCGRSDRDLALATTVLRVLFAELDGRDPAKGEDEPEPEDS
ncbi:MAG: helix-turn-helix transcriptional regulator [Enhygromyxa sp.]